MPDGTTLDRFTADEVIRHRLALLRFESGTTAEMLTILDTALREVDAAFVAGLKSGMSADELRRLHLTGIALEARIREARPLLTDTLHSALSETATAERAFLTSLPRGIAGRLPALTDAILAEIVDTPLGGARWSQRIAIDLYEETHAIKGVIGSAVRQSASVSETAEALRRGTKIVETYRGRFVAIARTEIQRVANDVALRTFTASNAGGVQWIATLDSSTCLLCAPMQGKIWRFDSNRRLPDDFRPPPLHPRCRCAISVTTKSYREMNGAPPTGPMTIDPTGRLSFPAWLNRQSKATQLDFFDSQERYDAWKAGVPLSGFASSMRVLNLGELRARYPTPP